ncbi:hypothetical protein [Cryobacterium shii]|uniref:Uncharacterized protein n=1 Tax=Cryobacterium shii TaxID=1259235 RepID=A0AAQ2C5P3_9MICO|nr:hypothetical protein [Cryobacterium shii]TFC45885.1 hypothetical protein E3O49_10235 [Cryobacterium shii]
MTEKPSIAQIISGIRFSEESQPLEYLIDSGLLYWINREAFHLHGFALVLDSDEAGQVTGFRMVGQGREPMSYAHEAVAAKERYVNEVLTPQYPPRGHIR